MNASLSRRRIVQATGAALATAALPALAQSGWPSRPIRIVVPYTAGGFTDQMARLLTVGLQKQLGQPVVIDNKPGANGMLGAEAVASAPPDGYTILIGTNSTNAALKFLMKKLPYDQDTAFAPVAYVGSVPLMVAVNNDVPAKTLKELIDMAKAKPGQVSVAYASTSQQVSSAMLASISPDTSCEVQALANVTWPGLALARSTNSLSVLAGTSAFTATISGTEPR